MDKRAEQEIEGADETRADLVYDALVAAILSRELTPGMKLSETIGSVFEVSRTVVRAAFNRLHSESLVEFKKNRGAFVASPTLKEAREVFRVRTILEREVAGTLAREISAADLAELETLNARQREAHRNGHDADAMKLAEEFHLRAAQMTGNTVLESMLSKLIVRTALVLGLYGTHNRSECGIDEHEIILKAMRERDETTAANAMVHHLDHVVERALQTGPSNQARTIEAIMARYAQKGHNRAR